MKVIIDGDEYIKKPVLVKCVERTLPREFVLDDKEAMELYHKGYEPLCPECGYRSFPTNFPALCFGGKKEDKSIVWFCCDMGHCAFSMGEQIKWQKKEIKDAKPK